MANRNLNSAAASTRTWATAHVIAATAIAAALGFILGAILF